MAKLTKKTVMCPYLMQFMHDRGYHGGYGRVLCDTGGTGKRGGNREVY